MKINRPFPLAIGDANGEKIPFMGIAREPARVP
jgi:hypothetical protein